MAHRILGRDERGDSLVDPQRGCSLVDPQRGYSLIELMAALTITLFVMGGVFGLMIENQRIYAKQTRLADVQQSARVALDLMTREIRMAGADPSGRAFNVPVGCIVVNEYQGPADAR